ncbi:hypothetical protein CERSUDRAFT_153819 [Gelatoporia subvermispora B]|uniref:Cytochrome P450 n=1 Tax=Ceriporiopsis subvermispora (strain B) TaxID=914234 RepID=M2RFP3_CERS8|nr:hypothetical protein CERSUDRAFT_153819 [Gelatoporia subvermispora B]
MTALEFLAALLTVASLARWWYRRTHLKLPLPPGPPRLPIIGNVFDVPVERASEAYLEMGQKLCSDTICLDAMGTYIVVLNSLSAATDLLEKRSTVYSDRPWMTMLSELVGLGWSLPLLPYGDAWKMGRRMFHQEMSTGPAVARNRRVEQQETRILLSRLLNEPQEFLHHIRHMAGAIIIQTAYGIEVQSKDDPYVHIAEKAIEGPSAASTPGKYLVDALPILKYVPSWFPGGQFKREAAEFRNWADALLNVPFDALSRRIAQGENPDCAATSLLETFGKTSSGTDIKHHIKTTLATMYIAGADTVVSTLATFFLAMVLYPEVQEAARKELDAALGDNRLPSLSDQAAMPYISAIVKESLRWKPVVPLNFPHRLTEDDTYRGYHIPRGSFVVANNWAILHDENIYSNPSTFNPSRFMKGNELDADIQDPAVAAFGFGRRICPGRAMAQDLLWITIASVLATFTISKEVDSEGNEIMPETASLPGFLRHPKPFRCTIKVRSTVHAAMVEESARE